MAAGFSRIWHLGAAISVLLLGLASRWPPLELPVLGKYPGDALWALMVFCGLGVMAPRASTVGRGIVALTICGVVELAKLDQDPWLSTVRSGTLGHLLLGRRFTPMNVPAYLVGILVGMVGETLARRVAARHGEGAAA